MKADRRAQRLRRFAAGTAALLLALPAVADGGLAIEGFDRSRLLAPAGARIEDYGNAGYHLRRRGGEVHVEVDASALASSSRFTLPPIAAADPTADPVARLARSLTVGAGTHYQASSRLLGWVAGAIDYNLDRGQPQDAAAVLERRSGYCTGVARLTVALHAAVGILSREVAGWVADPLRGGYHRWVEVYLPDRGWVFSDPLSSHHYVPATYLRLAAEELLPELGTDGLLLERREALVAADPYLYAAAPITARRNSDRQVAAVLRLDLDGGGGGRAVLTGRGERRTRPLVAGRTAFVGLEPGRYELRLSVPGGVIERSVDLPGRVRKTLSLPALSPLPAADRRRRDAPAPSNDQDPWKGVTE